MYMRCYLRKRLTPQQLALRAKLEETEILLGVVTSGYAVTLGRADVGEGALKLLNLLDRDVRAAALREIEARNAYNACFEREKKKRNKR